MGLKELIDDLNKENPDLFRALRKLKLSPAEYIVRFIDKIKETNPEYYEALISRDLSILTEKELEELKNELFTIVSSSKKMLRPIVQYQNVKNHCGFLTEEENKRICEDIAKKIHENLTSEQQKKFSEEKLVYLIPILNIGVTSLPAFVKPKRQENLILDNRNIFEENPDIASRALARSYQQELQRYVSEKDHYNYLEKLIEHKSDRKDSLLKTIKHGAHSLLMDVEHFWSYLIQRSDGKGIRPLYHQALRVYQFIKNGSNRLVCNDSTSAGKTLTAIITKAELDLKLGRKAKALVIAPDQALDTAWTQKEVNKYLRDLNYIGDGNEQKVTEIHKTNLDVLDGDFVKINYGKLGFKDYETKITENKYFKFLKDNIDKFDMIIIDECHNNKNPSSNRAKVIKSFIDKLGIEKETYLMMLSASLVTHKLKDMGVPLHFLDPENYPFLSYDYNSNPTAIRDAILLGKLFTISRNDIKTLFNLPELKEEEAHIEMDEGHVEDYFKVWSDGDSELGSKVTKLRKILLKSKFKGIEELIKNTKETSPKNERLAICTNLTTGITDELVKLCEKYYGKGEVGKINGKEPKERRIETARKFREGIYKALVFTDKTAGEGIPLTPGNAPVTAIVAEPQLSHGVYDQVIGRFYREGQKERVKIITAIGKSKKLEELMMENKGRLEEKYNIKFSRSWRASTLDLDIYEIRKKREEIKRDKVDKGAKLQDVELAIMNMDLEDGSSIKDALEADQEADKNIGFKSMFGKIKKSEFIEGIKGSAACTGMGREELLKVTKGEGTYLEFFGNLEKGFASKEWEKTSSAETQRLTTSVINGLEERYKTRYERIVDFGCGTACLARILKRPIINYDISANMLKMGRENVDKKIDGDVSKKMTYMQGFMQETPFKDKSLDIVVASYSFHFNSQYKDKQTGKIKREVEDIVLEFNRILKKDCFAVIALPSSTKRVKEIKKIFQNYGFEIKIADLYSGIYQEGDKKRKSFNGCYYLVCQKKQDVRRYRSNFVTIYSPERRKAIGREQKLCLSPIYNLDKEKTKIKDKKHPDNYVTKNGKNIVEQIRSF